MGYIGQASSDEVNGVNGALSGNQTGVELNKKSWYSLPWHTYIECKDEEIAEKALSYLDQIVKNKDFGYSQKNRWSGLFSIIKNNKKVKGASGDFDCSSLVISAYILAGVQMAGEGNTSSLKKKLLATGLFTAYTSSSYIQSDRLAKKGSIFLGNGHCCMSYGGSGNKNSEESKIYLGEFTLTGYCPCVKCCGKSDGITASGKKAKASHTIAVDKSVIPLGSKVLINGKVYVAEDVGGAIKGKKIDIFFNSHSEALAFGKQKGKVYLLTENYSTSVEKKELDKVVVLNTSGDGGVRKNFIDINDREKKRFKIFIAKGSTVFSPEIINEIVITRDGKFSPSCLKFSVLKDEILDFHEGDTVIMRENDVGIFYGYIFSKTRDKDKIINVLCYDQLRYFKNKDTYIYKNKTASELFKMVAKDFRLKVGEVDETGVKISKRIEENKTIFDILKNSINLTKQVSGQEFVFFDQFGSLMLKESNKLFSEKYICEENCQDFFYRSSIDEDVFNVIELFKDNFELGQKEKYVYQKGELISKWGILKHCQELNEGQYPDKLGKEILKQKARTKRYLKVKGFLGDFSLRPGYKVFVNLNLGDIILKEYMVVESATLYFSEGYLKIDLVLVGGEFE